MKTRNEWREAVQSLPVFDTHTHLNRPNVPIAAQSVWDIVEYFWFRQELESVGYPKHIKDLSESDRIAHFVNAFQQARTTTWGQVIQHTFQDLYGVTLSDTESIRQANETVKSHGADPLWPREVANRLNVKRIVTNIESESDYPGLPGVGAAVPIWGGYRKWTDHILNAEDAHAAAEEAAETIRNDVAAIAARGHRGMRLPVDPFQRGPIAARTAAVVSNGSLPSREVSSEELQTFFAHTFLRALSDHGLFAQLFLGIVSIPGAKTIMGISDPHTIPTLYPLFERYECDFELVSGAAGLNMDVAQAARIHPNVHAGGLWWYNFRPSTYRDAMQVRLEAVPPSKCALVASDGRCIEWCYAKTKHVKTLLADFLHDTVHAGALGEHDALWVAREWLHDAPARRYT